MRLSKIKTGKKKLLELNNRFKVFGATEKKVQKILNDILPLPKQLKKGKKT